MYISQRARNMQSSPIRRLIPFAEQAKRNGIQVMHLNIGDPDIPTPRPFFDSIASFPGPVVPYSHSAGLIELRKEFCAYYRHWGFSIGPEELIVTDGGSEAIIFAFGVIADPGDQVMVIEPFYANYRSFAEMMSLGIVPVQSDPDKGYSIPPMDQFEKALNPKVKGLILSNPCNPTGAVYSMDDIEMLLTFCKKNDLYLIVDEVYREFVFDGKKPFSAMQFSDYHDILIMVDSISKRYSTCGARVGALVSKNKEVLSQAMKMAQARLSPPTMAQYGALGLLKMDREYIMGVRDEYQRRRDTVYEELNKIPGLSFLKPQGAFYVSVKLPVPNSESFVKWMLTDFSYQGKTTMVAPLNGFYASPGAGEQEIRIAYVLEESSLRLSCEMLRIGLERYSQGR